MITTETVLVTTLQNLRNQALSLTRERAALVDHHQAMIDKANKEFDAQMVPLQRRIRALENERQESPSPVAVVTRKKSTRISVEDGFTQEEVNHYYELLKR